MDKSQGMKLYVEGILTWKQGNLNLQTSQRITRSDDHDDDDGGDGDGDDDDGDDDISYHMVALENVHCWKNM